MEDTGNMPKILPVWHDYWTTQSFNRQYNHVKFVKDGFPDFGGSGVDVSSGQEGCNVTTAKYSSDKVLFGADVCSLPFFPPKKVHLTSDPCMTSIHASNYEVKTFSATMEHVKRYHTKTHRKVHRKVSSLYTTLKDLQKKAKRKLEEILVPKPILNMALSIPESCQVQDANFNYLGGCLVSSKTVDGNPVLLHPTGRSLNKLGITPLVENGSQNKAFKSASPKYKSKKLKDTCIQKIRSSFAGHSFVQQDTFCHYINYFDSSNINSYELNREHGNFVNIQTSPYSPVDFLSTDETGVLEVFDVESWKTSWCSDKSLDLKSSIPLLKDCSFGSHPKSVLLLTENSVHAHDMRTKDQTGSLLFSKHFSNYQWEKFVTIKCLAPCNPFQSLISSTNHLYIIDERYPEKPVLIWNHILRSIPLYCDVACVESNNCFSDAIAFLGSQDSAETCLFSTRFPSDQIQPVSLANPLYPSVITDFYDSLRLHGVFVPDGLLKRIKTPLVGVCLLPNDKKKGFTCFQLSSYGDLFFQDFSEVSESDRELTHRVGTGCVLSPPSKMLPHIFSWTDYFSRQETEDPYIFKKSSDDRVLNLTEIFEKTSSISFGCNFCAFNAYSRDRKTALSTCCSSCGLNIMYYNDFMTEFQNLTLYSGPSEDSDLQYFDLTALEGFNSEESKGIFKVWNSSSDEIISTICLHGY